MFTSLELKNFKSIGHAKFDLGKINVLTGQSNLGKSNVVQAIYCLVHNHWDSNYLKWGEKKCSIRLTDDTGEWVEYRHNESSAEYSLSTVDQPFTKIGRDVPVPVREFLKMNEVQFDEDLSLDFNFERQFDPSFVISLSGFELAKVFGKLMNLDIVLSASRNINKDLSANRKAIDAQEAIENVSIEYIQKNFAIELKYALLHQVLKFDAVAEEMDAKASELKSILADLEYYQNCVDIYSSFLDDKSGQIDSIHAPIQGLDNIIASYIASISAVKAYETVLAKDLPSFDFEGLNGLAGAITDLAVASSKAQSYFTVLADIATKVDFDLVDTMVSSKGFIDNYESTENELNTQVANLKQVDSGIQNKKLEFTEYLKENNICPISGRPFMAGCTENIVDACI